MKVQPRFFQELAKRKYLNYIKSLPQFKKEQTEAYLMIILVVFTVSFFGIFAIMPTLSTIAELRKTLEDNTFINDQLQAKITNLSSLQQEYSQLSPDLPVLLAAIPQENKAPLLTGQVQALSQEAGVKVTKLQIQELTESKEKDKPTGPLKTFTVTVDAEGTYENLRSFYTSLIRFERIVTFDSMIMTMNRENNTLQLNIKANVYYQK